MNVKVIILIFTAIIIFNTGFAGTGIPVGIYGSSAQMKDSSRQYNNQILHKKLPTAYEREIISALAYFPELAKIPVKFRVKRSVSTLKTRPSFISMLMPKGLRSYIIIISNKTLPELSPLTLANLPENARVGIIGHELSHVVDFSKKSTWQCIKTAFDHLSKTFMDSLEFNTDKICIEHGLGYNLEAWSCYIRDTMHTTYWRGADFVKRGDSHYERYMNPDTIEMYMQKGKQVRNPSIANAY